MILWVKAQALIISLADGNGHDNNDIHSHYTVNAAISLDTSRIRCITSSKCKHSKINTKSYSNTDNNNNSNNFTYSFSYCVIDCRKEEHKDD